MSDAPDVLSAPRRFRRGLVVLSLALLLAVYLLVALGRAWPLYQYAKGGERGFVGALFQADPALGFAPVPYGQGFEALPGGVSVPVRFDARGFRVPATATPSDGPGPRLLFLGCSFTYGGSVTAEQAFPERVAQRLHGRALNAGVSGQGLAHMVVRAERLLPAYQPDYLVVQYSPWLVQRGMSAFSPVYAGLAPAPYFTGDEKIEIAPPAFQPRLPSLPLDAYRFSERGPGDYLGFFRDVALPLFAHDDLRLLAFRVRQLTGAAPWPSRDGLAVASAAYGYLDQLARANGARLVIVVVGNEDMAAVPFDVFPKGALVVDTQAALLAELPVRTREAYGRRYWHWRGTPPVFVDAHPNPRAHALIAEAVVAALAPAQGARPGQAVRAGARP